MMLIGVDYHPSFQTIAFFVEETGECGEQELKHSDGEAERFYRDLQKRGIRVRVGMEATGFSRWFERLLAELGFQVWMGDPAEIKAKRVKKQKFDREDARLLRRLMLENNFPQIWVLGPENRDLLQLLWHRHRLVQMRTRITNQLQALAMNEGYRWKKKLFSKQGRALLEKLSLAPWASRRRQELLELLDRMNPTIEELTAAAEREAKKRPEVLRLMTHPGVGPTALAITPFLRLPLQLSTAKGSLTKEERNRMTPAQVIEELKKGNDRFRTGKMAPRDYVAEKRSSAAGQYPAAVILGCVDSGVPAEIVFDVGIGDTFDGRIAGNVVNDDLLGSMEFACAVSGAKLVLVLGHTACGAVKGAIDDVASGNLTGLQARIKPAIPKTKSEGEKSSKNPAYVDAVARTNMKLAMENICRRSPVLADLEKKGSIQISGAMYSLSNGMVDLVS